VCPQFDALFGKVTAREHLEAYSRIKGVPKEEVKADVDYILKRLQLGEKSDECTDSYSGGNKRKLSVALATLGDPDIIFLDEPSTGMDPSTRRFLWDFIGDIRHERCVVLTTHSMEEADALCTQIGIMVNGTMRCLGSSQELKVLYGTGYVLSIKLNALRAAADRGVKADAALQTHLQEALEAFVKELYPEATLMVNSSTAIRNYEIPRVDIDLGAFFEAIEARRTEIYIADYSISMPTMEQVFNRFARDQAEDLRLV
jgi:ABC-type multidrug transport system ATPase subunit